MSQPNSIDPALVPETNSDETAAVAAQPSAPVRKRGFDVYTMMLILSSLALLIGTILLYLDRLRHS